MLFDKLLKEHKGDSEMIALYIISGVVLWLLAGYIALRLGSFTFGPLQSVKEAYTLIILGALSLIVVFLIPGLITLFAYPIKWIFTKGPLALFHEHIKKVAQ